MEEALAAGLSMLRWAAWAWMAAVLAVSHKNLDKPWLAVGLVAVALVFTAESSLWARQSPRRLFTVGAVSLESALALALVVGDGFAYGSGHAFSTSQSLGSVWPLVSVLSAGLVFGAGWGVASGLILGLGRVGATLANGVRHFDGPRTMSLVNTVVFYAVAGAAAGYVTALLRKAEREISAARAREEVARTLHDGVLQTLAVVERRSTDPDLVRLAHNQDRDLRRYLFGDYDEASVSADLGAALRAAAARFETNFGVRADVIVADDVPSLEPEAMRAIGLAVSEALTNTGKHAGARGVTVYAEPTDDGKVFCSVKDDGHGFDPTAVPRGVGITRSIVDRMADIGGRAEVRSTPGRGTEVCLWS
jgi:signal transduction histidine kinase